MDYEGLIHRLINMESLEKYYNSGYSGIYSDAIAAITDLLVENQSLRNAVNGFKACTQRNRDASVSEKPLMGFHVPSDAFDPKNGIESWPSEYKHPKRKKVNQNVEDKKGENNG